MSSQGALKKFDDMIKRGEARLVRAELRKIESDQVSRSLVSQVAAIARRCNIPSISLRLLYPIVRNPQGSQATAAEKAEYAAALTYIGAAGEASTLLKEINPREVPEVDLYFTFALFSRWEYRRAFPFLERFINSPKTTDYQKTVGRVNLVAALIFDRQYEEADRLIASVLKATDNPHHTFLHGNILELAAQNAIQRGLHDTGDRYLLQARALLSNAGGLFEFFVRKWLAVNRVFRTGASFESLVELKKIREEANLHKHWETIRDCDRFLAIAKKDLGLAQRVYFGTPFRPFRERLVEDFGDGLVIPPIFYRTFVPDTNPIGILDIAQGTYEQYLDSGIVKTFENGLPIGEPVHKLLIALASDPYSPLRLPSLFGKIFSGEQYNPTASNPRVFRVIQKLRQWLETNRIPVTVDEKSGFYSLSSEVPIAIKMKKLD